MLRCTFLILLKTLGFVTAAAAAERGKLVVRVVDWDTGNALTARLVLRAADGTFPGDRLELSADRWPHINAHAVFIAGEQGFDLPAGKTTVVASHGPQYSIDAAEIDVAPAGTASLQLRLKHQVDMAKLGWLAGDAHLHMIHGEMQRQTSYHEVAQTCNANGLDWACVNQEYVGAGSLDLAGYQAECAKESGPAFHLMLGGERPKSLLGHYCLIGADNPFIVPDDPPYHVAARAVHAQGGVLFAVHPVRYYPQKKLAGAWLDFPGNNLARELVFDAYAGPSFDGLSVLSDEPNDRNAHQLWWNLLNRGFFVPVFADSDACFDRLTLNKNVPGFWATYVNVGPGGKADGATLAEGIRRGRTTATTGPLLRFDIDGQISGSTISCDGKPHRLSIHVHHAHHNWTLAEDRVAKVELIRGGKVVRTWEPNEVDAGLSCDIVESGPCWYAVRAFGTDARWQVAVASPIYFARAPVPQKREPLNVRVRGRTFDFATGTDRSARVEVRRAGRVLKALDARGQFTIDMPLDAEIVATADGFEPLAHNLLLDYRPVHQFLWNLTADDLGKPDTLDRFEALVREVDVKFPMGYRMPGCYAAHDLKDDAIFESVRIVEGPRAMTGGGIAVAALLLDKRQVNPGDSINVCAIFRDERSQAGDRDTLLVVEGRGYDPARPSGFDPLKLFGSVESNWSKAVDLGGGYRMIRGKLTVAPWVHPGPVGAVEFGVRSRERNGNDLCHVGLRVPLGPGQRALMACSGWPTMPLSWPDHNYGIGPLKVCGKNGRAGQPRGDYRGLHLMVKTSAGEFDLFPSRDCRGCADAERAVYVSQFFDEVLNEESHLVVPESEDHGSD